MGRRQASFEEVEPELRRKWESEHPGSSLDWLEIREAYLFGWTMARLSEFQNIEWKDAEPDLAQHWFNPMSPSEESTWDNVKAAVQEGWNQSRRLA